MPADAHQVVGTLGAAVLPPRGPPPIPAVQAGNVSVKASIARRPSTSPGLRRRCSCTPAPDGELDALVRKLIEKAKAGDVAALRLCLDRLLPPRRDRLVTFALPKIESAKDACAAAAAIMAACANGELSPREAVELMGLVEAQVRMFETTEFEARLAALEAKEPPSP